MSATLGTADPASLETGACPWRDRGSNVEERGTARVTERPAVSLRSRVAVPD